ncbi:MAG: hypothetical protein U5K69_02610 [Balneolaceae bacterium]|nr:hypothetical protein [Balneolaceae bacterium]
MLNKKRGDYVKEGETIARGFTNNEAVIDSALQTIRGAVTVGAEHPGQFGLIQYRADKKGVHELKT